MTSNKKYGLLIPKFTPGQMKPKLSIFNEESSDSDDQGGTAAAVNKALKKQSVKTEKKQTKIDIARALQDDPTVYQYDELFDDMNRKREEVKVKNKEDRKPKYIHSLLKQAERRKREQERRTERQVQKEREAEGEEFKDKESFVTSAYREKLEEFKKMEEEEKYQDQLEELTEVSKQKDLSGFYRHIYRQTVSGENNKPSIEKESIKKEILSDKEVSSKSNDEKSETDKEENLKFKKRKRKYRERKNSSSSEREENIAEKLDADLSINSSSSSSESENEEVTKKDKKEEVISKKKIIKNKKQKLEPKEAEEETNQKDDKENSGESSLKSTKKSKEPKEKIDIWKKRTVGEKLKEALEKYYQRKKVILQELESTGSLQDSPYFNPEKYKYF